MTGINNNLNLFTNRFNNKLSFQESKKDEIPKTVEAETPQESVLERTLDKSTISYLDINKDVILANNGLEISRCRGDKNVSADAAVASDTVVADDSSELSDTVSDKGTSVGGDDGTVFTKTNNGTFIPAGANGTSGTGFTRSGGSVGNADDNNGDDDNYDVTTTTQNPDGSTTTVTTTVNADGTKRVETVTLDANGNKIESKSEDFDTNGRVKYRWTQKYDPNHKNAYGWPDIDIQENFHYNEDGSLKSDSKSVYTYNSNTGNLVLTASEENEYWPNGNIKQTFVNEYKGNITIQTKTVYNENGDIDVIDMSEFENGKQTKYTRTEYGLDGKIDYKQESEYDSNGKITKYTDTYYDADGKVKSSSVSEYEHDSNGNLTKAVLTDYDADGKVTKRSVCETEYDSRGNETKKVDTYYDGKVTERSVYETEYDSRGNKTKEVTTWYNQDGKVEREIVEDFRSGTKVDTYYNSDGKIREKYEYEHGKLMKSEDARYDSNGNITWKSIEEYEDGKRIKQIKIELKYDDGGRVVFIRSSINGHVSESEITYDKWGNVIAQGPGAVVFGAFVLSQGGADIDITSVLGGLKEIHPEFGMNKGNIVFEQNNVAELYQRLQDKIQLNFLNVDGGREALQNLFGENYTEGLNKLIQAAWIATYSEFNSNENASAENFVKKVWQNVQNMMKNLTKHPEYIEVYTQRSSYADSSVTANVPYYNQSNDVNWYYTMGGVKEGEYSKYGLYGLYRVDTRISKQYEESMDALYVALCKKYPNVEPKKILEILRQAQKAAIKICNDSIDDCPLGTAHNGSVRGGYDKAVQGSGQFGGRNDRDGDDGDITAKELIQLTLYCFDKLLYSSL